MIKSRKQKGTTASRKRLREDEEQDPGHQTNISTTTPEENNSNNHDDDSETLQPPLKRMAQKPSSSLHFHTTSKSSKKNSALDDNDSDDLQQVPTTDFHHQASRDMRCATDQLVTSTNDLLMSDDEANHKNKNKNKGPKKPSANVRFNTQMDHQPGICKDYYETGFCGYGDNCVFAHIREEWKSGWKQDKEWEQLQKKQKKQKQVAEDGGENDSSDKKNNEKDDDGLPHACFICRQPFVDPVVTVCKHYFCESCALKRFNGGKNPKCAACGAQTNGQFNTARDIIQKMKKLQQTTVK